MEPRTLIARLPQAALAPVYLLHGEEPLQRMEAADALRARARELGHLSRELLDVQGGFDWSALGAAADSYSLFAERRLIELRLNAAKPGSDGGAALQAYARRPAEDAVLLILCDRLDRSAQRTAWFKAIDGVGVQVPCNALSAKRLAAWVQERAGRAGLRPTAGAVALICSRVEGNLLAAAQEIDKLRLVHGEGELDEAQVLAAVADSARFNLYDFGNAALAGDTEKCARALWGLRDEGTAAPLVLWLLGNELRTLVRVAGLQRATGNLGRAFAEARIPQFRQPLLRQTLARHRASRLGDMLTRCGALDRALKGMDVDGRGARARDTHWLLLLELGLDIAGRSAAGGEGATRTPSL